MKTLNTLSVFSGCGGLDLGMEQAGFKIRACVEKDRTCQKTIRANRPGVPIFDDVFSGDLLEYVKKTKFDAVVGGPPCQSFSTIGRRGLLKDPRGRAMLGFIELIETAMPRLFLMENVLGLVSAGKGKIVQELVRRLKRAGYNCVYSVLNAARYGVPQNRLRFVMVGALVGQPRLPKGDDSITTLWDAIHDLENIVEGCAKFSPKMGRVLRHVPEGGCWKSLPPKMQDEAMGNANRRSGGLTAFYRRLSYDRPSPTLVTAPNQRATTLCHPRQNRPLSVAEYKRIQCFPDDWRIEGTIANQYKQIGNAVPVPLGKALGETLREVA